MLTMMASFSSNIPCILFLLGSLSIVAAGKGNILLTPRVVKLIHTQISTSVTTSKLETLKETAVNIKKQIHDERQKYHDLVCKFSSFGLYNHKSEIVKRCDEIRRNGSGDEWEDEGIITVQGEINEMNSSSRQSTLEIEVRSLAQQLEEERQKNRILSTDLGIIHLYDHQNGESQHNEVEEEFVYKPSKNDFAHRPLYR